MTKRKVRVGEWTCTCKSYKFPHRGGSGQCQMIDPFFCDKCQGSGRIGADDETRGIQCSKCCGKGMEI